MNEYQQAIKDIKYALCRNYDLCKLKNNDYYGLLLKDRWQKKVNMLEDLADRATPERPLLILGKMICPDCREEVIKGKNFCSECGKALDWEG